MDKGVWIHQRETGDDTEWFISSGTLSENVPISNHRTRELTEAIKDAEKFAERLGLPFLGILDVTIDKNKIFSVPDYYALLGVEYDDAWEEMEKVE